MIIDDYVHTIRLCDPSIRRLRQVLWCQGRQATSGKLTSALVLSHQYQASRCLLTLSVCISHFDIRLESTRSENVATPSVWPNIHFHRIAILWRNQSSYTNFYAGVTNCLYGETQTWLLKRGNSLIQMCSKTLDKSSINVIGL